MVIDSLPHSFCQNNPESLKGEEKQTSGKSYMKKTISSSKKEPLVQSHKYTTTMAFNTTSPFYTGRCLLVKHSGTLHKVFIKYLELNDIIHVIYFKYNSIKPLLQGLQNE
jgi:hypothetical protein